jgi:hypothetical protein
MTEMLSDGQITNLMTEVKSLPDDYRSRVVPRQKRGHSERELDIDGSAGNQFRLILRQSSLNVVDFSVILAWLPPQRNSVFRLCRYNILENTKFYDFHIHHATERYQRSGLREDSFAEATQRYQDWPGALQAMIKDCGFRLPANDQLGLI